MPQLTIKAVHLSCQAAGAQTAERAHASKLNSGRAIHRAQSPLQGLIFSKLQAAGVPDAPTSDESASAVKRVGLSARRGARTVHEADGEAGVQRPAVGLLQRRPLRRVQQVARPVRPRLRRQILHHSHADNHRTENMQGCV